MEPAKVPGLVWVPVFMFVALAVGVIAVTPYDQEGLVLLVGVAAINAVLSPLVGLAASKKGRSFWAFFWLSLVIGLVIPALIVATINQSESKAKAEEEKTCPKCAENVKRAALVCRFCGNHFEPIGAPTQEIASPSNEPQPFIGEVLSAPFTSRIAANKFALLALIFSLVTILEASAVWLAIGGFPIPIPPWPFSFGYTYFLSLNALISGVAAFVLALVSKRRNEKYSTLAVSLSSVSFLAALSQFVVMWAIDAILALFF